MFNNFGGAADHINTAVLLKTVAGILLIREDLFGGQRRQQGLLLPEDAVDGVCGDYAKSKTRRDVAANIDGSILILLYKNTVTSNTV